MQVKATIAQFRFHYNETPVEHKDILTMIIIIGAGLAGLSIARSLSLGSYRLFEKESSIGGLCRSFQCDGFTFDYTGHLLHGKSSAAVKTFKKILPEQLLRIKRNAAIYVQKRFVPYPFQAHLFGLPTPVVRECVLGFLSAPARRTHIPYHINFRRWVRAHFGAGIARHFFIPYNEKLWCRDLRQLVSSWAARAVPVPTVQEVLRGTLGAVTSGLGYNASFYYPVRGGIQTFMSALADGIPDITTGCGVRAVHAKQQMVTLDDGRTQRYERLVSTIPLPDLIAMIEDAPRVVRRAAAQLSFVSVYNINLGINRPQVTDRHWIYFPDPAIPFYRIGCYTNFTPHLAPAGTSSLYLEIALQPDEHVNADTLFTRSLHSLRQCGLLLPSDYIVARCDKLIRCAYVVFDAARQQALPIIFSYLHQHHIIPAGRYGRWDYASMHDTILQGQRIARTLL